MKKILIEFFLSKVNSYNQSIQKVEITIKKSIAYGYRNVEQNF